LQLLQLYSITKKNGGNRKKILTSNDLRKLKQINFKNRNKTLELLNSDRSIKNTKRLKDKRLQERLIRISTQDDKIDDHSQIIVPIINEYDIPNNYFTLMLDYNILIDKTGLDLLNSSILRSNTFVYVVYSLLQRLGHLLNVNIEILFDDICNDVTFKTSDWELNNIYNEITRFIKSYIPSYKFNKFNNDSFKSYYVIDFEDYYEDTINCEGIIGSYIPETHQIYYNINNLYDEETHVLDLKSNMDLLKEISLFNSMNSAIYMMVLNIALELKNRFIINNPLNSIEISTKYCKIIINKTDEQTVINGNFIDIFNNFTSYYLIENPFLDIKTYYEQFGYNTDIGKFPEVVFPTFVHDGEIYEDNIANQSPNMDMAGFQEPRPGED